MTRRAISNPVQWVRAQGSANARSARKGFKLRTYFLVLIALVVVSAVLGVVYVRVQAGDDARQAASQDAAFAANQGARLIDNGVSIIQPALKGIASNPDVETLFSDPSKCVLGWAPVGAFGSGHFELLRSDGSIVCSSRGKTVPSQPNYAGQSWLAMARTEPLRLAPVDDPVTNKPAALISEPAAGGVIAALIDLRPIGAKLAAQFAGPRKLEFVVTTAGNDRVVTSSKNSQRWTGASLAGSRFASTSRADRPDLTGTRTLFAHATATTLGWRVYAGANRAATFDTVDRLYRRELTIIGLALLFILAASALTYRRIAQPIGKLAQEMHTRAPDEPAGANGLRDLRGPAEIQSLASNFDELTEAVSRELTQRVQAEETARAAADSYRALFESNPQPMWIYDPTTLAIIEVNDAAIARYGYTREEFESLTIVQLRPADDVPRLMENLEISADVLDRSGPWVHVTKDGTRIEVEISSHRVDFQGKAGRLVMASDVTQREELQRQLAQSQRLESLGQLAGGIAHDFNNLLGAIMNYASFVREEIDSAVDTATSDSSKWHQARSDIGQIEKAAHRAAELTHQLLAFARQEVIQPRAVDLNDVVNAVELMLRRTLGENIELTCKLQPQLPATIADPGQLEQVLVNLAVNARDAMPTGGRLTIETQDVDVDDVYASSRPDLTPGHYVRLRVSDTGAGMDATTLQHAFEPFYTTKPKGEGTGLGLATTYGIITQAGGYVQIYSEPGMGTTVSALLPASSRSAGSLAPLPTPDVHRSGESLTILLVEDEDAIREVAERLLTKHGYHVLTAPNPSEAIDLANGYAEHIALLVTDVVMPQMPGTELARRIVENRPGIKVLFMSGYAQQILGVSIGPETILLEKPFTEAALLAKLEQALAAAS